MENRKKLDKYWFSDGWIDFEFKKYTLLSYLKDIDHFFSQSKLYPCFSELIEHYTDLYEYKKSQFSLEDSFKKDITGIDIQEMKIHFEKNQYNDTILEEMMKIIEYAQNEFKVCLDQGEEIYGHIVNNIQFDTVGVIPFYNKEGYLLISCEGESKINVYRYAYSLIHHNKNKFYGLKTKKISSNYHKYVFSPGSIKVNLIKNHKDLPNPATYILHSDLKISLEHSILPVAKRWLIKEIATAA